MSHPEKRENAGKIAVFDVSKESGRSALAFA
jgi:hypothetical protein